MGEQLDQRGPQGAELPDSIPPVPEFFPRTRCDGLRLVTSGSGYVPAPAREFGRSRRLAARVEKPIVLHHGEHGWTEPVSLRELYDAPAELLDALGPFLPALTFLLDDLTPQGDAALRARTISSVARMTIWAFMHVRQEGDVTPALRAADDLLLAMIDAPSGLAALDVLVRYILKVTGTPAREIQVIVDQLGRPEASKIVMTAAEQLRKEGRREGHKENQRDYLIRLLSQRFGQLPDSLLARIQRADVTLLDRWFDRGITSPSLDAVFADEP
jgi:hypothetical protein